MLQLKNFKSQIINVSIGTILFIVMLVNLLPVFYMFILSIKPTHLVFEQPISISFRPTLEVFKEMFTYTKYYKFLINSFLVATTTTVLALIIGSMASFAFVFFSFRGKNTLLFTSLFTRMFPPLATLIPIFFVMSHLGLLDTLQSLIITCTAIHIPLVLLVMRTFFADIPREIQENALLDGCSPFGLFTKIIVPLSLPGLVASGVLVFVLTWNEFLLALVLTSFKAKTAPVAIMAFIETEAKVTWNFVAALGLVIILPAVLFTLIFHKFLIRGLTLGAVKG